MPLNSLYVRHWEAYLMTLPFQTFQPSMILSTCENDEQRVS
jgi:hypothetical protein